MNFSYTSCKKFLQYELTSYFLDKQPKKKPIKLFLFVQFNVVGWFSKLCFD